MTASDEISRRLLKKGAVKAALAIGLSYLVVHVFDSPRILIWLGWVYAVLALILPQIMLRVVAKRRLTGLMAGKKARRE